jgi:hypothetical protein
MMPVCSACRPEPSLCSDAEDALSKSEIDVRIPYAVPNGELSCEMSESIWSETCGRTFSTDPVDGAVHAVTPEP